jgi:ATP-dependent DNA helicase PIF1
LKLGQKIHSTVKEPCTDFNAERCFPISAGSELARVIRDNKLFVWDEVSMAHKHLMNGPASIFKDIMQDGRPFGGNLVVTSGDFRQNLPIIPGGPEAQIKSVCLMRSPLWNTVTKLGLTGNKRGIHCSESERASIEQDNTFLLAMGDGALPNPYPEENPYLGRLPASICMSVTDDAAGIPKL